MAKQVEPNVIFLQTSPAVESKVGDETILLHCENGNYYGLNAVGTRAWAFMKDGASLEDICRDLQKEYDVAEKTLELDLQKFFQDLLEQDLISEKSL